MTLAFALTLILLGLVGAFVAGLLGVGGAIVMIPLLLYVPTLLGVGQLDAKAVAGVTMAQVLVAAISVMIAHPSRKIYTRALHYTRALSIAAARVSRCRV